ncbi:hypothetical protein I6F07_21165 [Ensifer sp. IC4062]|nr:hypothetical protein [Ensifer sp. IC4062]MCA1442684.1 hypothetical protein [Ensifer sp. IC4062]
MRYLLSGYGTDSKTGDVKQYRTLRGEIQIDERSIAFRTEGVSIQGTEVPCVTLDGNTAKVNKDSVDNKASLILFDMDENEALRLSAKLAEYALFLRYQKRTRVGFWKSIDEFSATAAEVLFESSRDDVANFLERIADEWHKSAKFHTEMASSPFSFPETSREKHEKSSQWRTECMKALKNLIHHYRSGEGDENTRHRDRLRILSNEPQD